MVYYSIKRNQNYNDAKQLKVIQFMNKNGLGFASGLDSNYQSFIDSGLGVIPSQSDDK
jgi:hypothetical protein